jgi:hypothetical protein
MSRQRNTAGNQPADRAVFAFMKAAVVWPWPRQKLLDVQYLLQHTTTVRTQTMHGLPALGMT